MVARIIPRLTKPKPDCLPPVGLFYFQKMTDLIIESEKELVNIFIENGIMPYKKNKNDDIVYLREYNVKDGRKIKRIDLVMVNKTKQRIDLIEFKNRRLTPTDFLQIADYYYLFRIKFPDLKKRTFCHLIGRESSSKDLRNLNAIGFKKMNTWFFYESIDSIKIYDQKDDCPF